MRIGTSLLLIAVGAVLRFAVNVTASGFSVHTIGVIVMIAGIVGLILSLVWLAAWSGRRNQTRYVERREVVRPRSRY